MAKKKIVPTDRKHSVALKGGVASSRPPPKPTANEPPDDPPVFAPAAPIPRIDMPVRQAPQFGHGPEDAPLPLRVPPTETAASPASTASVMPEPATVLVMAAPAARVQARLSELRARNEALDLALARLNWRKK